MSLIPLTTPHFHTPLYPPHLAPYREKFIAKIQNSSSHNTQPHIKVSSPTTQKKTEAAKVQLLNMQKSGIKEGIRVLHHSSKSYSTRAREACTQNKGTKRKTSEMEK